MSFFRIRSLLFAGSLSFAASACVTINIYFPAAAAEKAADRIIDEVWQTRENQPPQAAPAEQGAGQ